MTAMYEEGDVPEVTMGLRLEIARRRVGLNQNELAAELGITRSTVYDYERGAREPKRGTLIAWARLTGVRLAWLETGSAASPEGGGTVTQLLPRLDSNQQPAAYQQLQVRPLRLAA